jgi:hypothetical protein
MREQEDLVEELPFNGHGSNGFIGKLIKCTSGKVNGVAVSAGRARVCYSNDNSFAIRGVGDLNLLATKARLDASVTVTGDIHCADKIGVLVHRAAGSGVSVLVKECRTIEEMSQRRAERRQTKYTYNPPVTRSPLSLELGAAVWDASGVEVGVDSEGAGVVVVAGAGVGSAWAAGAAWEVGVAAGAAEDSSLSPSSLQSSSLPSAGVVTVDEGSAALAEALAAGEGVH